MQLRLQPVQRVRAVVASALRSTPPRPVAKNADAPKTNAEKEDRP